MKLAPSDRSAAQRRRSLMDIALHRARPVMGTAAAQRRAEPSMRWPDLREILAGIPWAVTGAVAARLYMPERATRDLDILVLATEAERVGQRLDAAGFSRVSSLAIGGSSWAAPDGAPVAVIEVEEVWAQRAIAEAQSNRDAQGLPIVPLTYLVLMKLAASRVQDLADVSRMLGGASDTELQAVRRIVQAYAQDLTEDLNSLIHLGKLESGGGLTQGD